MNKLLSEEYFHLGTDRILKELWLNIQTDQIYKNYSKPYGGLWTTHQNKRTLSDWIAYRDDEPNGEIPYYMKSSLIKFKNNANIITITNPNDYKNLKNSGFVIALDKPLEIFKYYFTEIINELIDYEKLSNFYDLLYVNPEADKIFKNYTVKTMYALNPNCIDYYKPIKVNYVEHKILNIGKKTYIQEPTYKYFELVNYIKNLFTTITATTYDEYINKLNELKNIIIKNFHNEKYENVPFLNSTDIDEEELIETITGNIYREKYLEAQKRLVKK